MPVNPPTEYAVELPAGGQIKLFTPEEVDLWKSSAKRFDEDYHLTRSNEKVLLGALLSQQVQLYRAQQLQNGWKPEFDAKQQPTGRYIRVELKAAMIQAAQVQLQKSSEEIRELEKALGIDKKSRDSGGTHTVADYLTNLKRAAHQYGVHISERILAYEMFVAELRWRVRLLTNGDPEDRSYHRLTPEAVLEWIAEQLVELEEADKKFAKEKGRLFVGRL